MQLSVKILLAKEKKMSISMCGFIGILKSFYPPDAWSKNSSDNLFYTHVPWPSNPAILTIKKKISFYYFYIPRLRRIKKSNCGWFFFFYLFFQ